ncbi:hypothetical protein UAY_03353 [Enterococcus moraviensis ATCC BAA-383]|uniref:Uncharacterized protein n=1 Tax=Enterococcus moraviensis ATCC BAA-383 TaxID=1158609 RepID=R2QHA3_9ENTE|nr:hypothetical protein [Enterococcus moraviensis]EOH95927.1 hypothetical protein UAY_03353 [Enterococcus moraviensis ATCC BAA-383]EOT66414.1 hypothetical protein I586_02685 [Enterococcus moraviensis ATCC BAA-383]OJG67523.1 hypothetical protein RV09_GL002292 [Enterococcus moraviensis]
MFKLEPIYEEKLKTYKKEQQKRLLLHLPLIMLLFLTIMPFFRKGIINGYALLLMIILFFFLKKKNYITYSSIEEYKQYFSLNAILLNDCDAVLWLYYLTKMKFDKRKRVSIQIEYINALLLTGEFEKASKKLSSINPNKIYSISDFVNYYIVKNNLSFYLQDMNGLQQIKNELRNLNYKRKSISCKILTLKESNQAYIECLEGDLDYKLYMGHRKMSASSNISKVNVAYVAYLASNNDLEYHKKCRNFIVKYGGTCFFKEVVESDEKK